MNKLLKLFSSCHSTLLLVYIWQINTVSINLAHFRLLFLVVIQASLSSSSLCHSLPSWILQILFITIAKGTTTHVRLSYRLLSLLLVLVICVPFLPLINSLLEPEGKCLENYDCSYTTVPNLVLLLMFRLPTRTTTTTTSRDGVFRPFTMILAYVQRKTDEIDRSCLLSFSLLRFSPCNIIMKQTSPQLTPSVCGSG